MQEINVPTYSHLLGNDAQIKAIMDLADYIRRWKPEMDAIEEVIPNEASSSNKLADKNYVDDSVTSMSATHQGSYNLVSDLSLTTAATRSDIATALASVITDAGVSDYCYVQIPIADATPTQLDHEERYKFDGTSWGYEYTPNLNIIDGVFDISAYNNNTKYADLVSALGTNGANVPQSVRKGGMLVKYVDSSDNKYRHYTYLLQYENTTAGNAAFANADNWQGVDEELVAGSHNLAESGLVYDFVNKSLGGVKISLTVHGVVLNGNTLITESENYRTSDYIAVNEGDLIRFETQCGGSAYTLTGYGDETQQSIVRNFCQLGLDSQSVNIIETVIPNDVNYIRITEHVDYSLDSSVFLFKNEDVDVLKEKVESLETNQTEIFDNLDKSIITLVNEKLSIPLRWFNFSNDLITISGTATTGSRRTTDYIPVVAGNKIIYSALQGSTGYCSLALYTSEKVFIKGIVSTSGEYIVEKNVAYIRFSALISGTPTAVIYNILPETLKSDFDKNLISSINGDITLPNSFYDYSNDLITTGGSVSTGSRRTTDYVKVSAGQIITYSGLNANPSYCSLVLYNSSKQYLRAGSSDDSGVYTVDNDVAYIRFSALINTTPIVVINNSVENSIDIIRRNNNRFTAFTSTTPRKPCIIFQQDGNPSLFANVFEYEAMLKTYSVPVSTYLIVPSTFATYGNQIKKLYNSGNEVSVHGESGESSGESTLQNYINTFSDNGIVPFGYVAHGTDIPAGNVPIARKYFSYIVKNGGDYNSYNDANYLNSVMSLSDYPYELKRLNIEVKHTDYESYKATIVANVKNAIDKAIQDTGLLCLYAHSYNETSGTVVTLYEDILEEILIYLKSYIDKGIVVVGNSADIIEYYYSKRYNE